MFVAGIAISGVVLYEKTADTIASRGRLRARGLSRMWHLRIHADARPHAPARMLATLPETRDWLQRLLALDFSPYMPGSVLTKVDHASMAHGLEARPPMLDNEMIDRQGMLGSFCAGSRVPSKPNATSRPRELHDAQ